MKAISAPWRMQYVKGEKPNHCVLCVEEHADKAFILKKGNHAFIMMNLYPYTPGHLMVAPRRHVALMENLTAEEKLEIFDFVVLSVSLLKKAMAPEGFNIGMNLGKAAGAGVEDHLHVHIVPRWSGDTNFVNVVGEIRVIPEDIAKTWEKLMSHMKCIAGEE
jgi:ATP adenylyltransferase